MTHAAVHIRVASGIQVLIGAAGWAAEGLAWAVEQLA